MPKINDALSWSIHGHAPGGNGKESEPHVHIDCSDGSSMSVAIEGAYVLAGGLKNSSKQEEALQWVKANYSMLKSKWDSSVVDN